jgi:carbon-monoxide dehydrogenase medium subunit
VIAAKFAYVRAQSLDEALALLHKHGDDAKVLAGGHSLIPAMKLRLAEPAVLVDIARIPDMNRIAASGGTVTIGALATHAALAASDAVREHAPALWDAASVLGDPQVRNRGTIGGAVAHADPAAAYPAVQLARDATIEIAGPGGARHVKADDFFRGLFETALEEGELIAALSFPAAPRSAYEKYRHPASHYAVVGVAARLDLDGGRIAAARVAVTGVGDGPFRAGGVEAALRGVAGGVAHDVERATAGTAKGVEARADVFATGAYRVAMADVYAARAVARAAER